LLLLLEQLDNLPIERSVDVYMILVGDAAEKEGLPLAEYIRNKVDGIKLQVNCGGGSFKSQFKKADKSGAEYAVILGEDEMSRGDVSLKPLRVDLGQSNMPRDELIQLLIDKI
jgi:histidyl-tRNA synthetase